jgi:hypothetical protein
MNVEILTTYERKSDLWPRNRRRQYKYDRPDYPSRVGREFGETVWEHLENRRSRPWQELKPLVSDALVEIGVSVDKLRWDINAGCGMCPCSGGFLVDGEEGKDYFAKVVNNG